MARMAWNRLSRPSMAEPAAESPSTIYSSHRAGSRSLQSWSLSGIEIIVSFANNVHTPEGGMHEEGLKRALTTVLNAYGKKANIFKGEEKVSGDD